MASSGEKQPRGKARVQPRRSAKRRDSKEIVEAILEAAVALASRSLEHVTTNAIAKRAGVGVASLYRYFPNKEAIFAEIARRRHLEYLAQLRAVLAEDPTIEEAVARCTRLLAVNDPKDRAIRRMLNIDIPLRWSREEAKTVNRGVMDELTQWLAERLDPVPDDLEERVFLVFGAVRGAMGLRLLEEAVAPRDEDLEAQLIKLGTWVFCHDMALPK